MGRNIFLERVAFFFLYIKGDVIILLVHVHDLLKKKKGENLWTIIKSSETEVFLQIYYIKLRNFPHTFILAYNVLQDLIQLPTKMLLLPQGCRGTAEAPIWD